MGLFDKKYCDICGEKIGLLGNRKLENGNLCKNCAKKLSPWFSDRRNNHCGCEDYCTLDKVCIGTHECDPTVDQCTDCLSFVKK